MSSIISVRGGGQYQDFLLYYKQENAIDFWQIVQDYMQGNLQGKSLPNECLARSVILIEIRGSKYILKADKEWDKRAEKENLTLDSWWLLFSAFLSFGKCPKTRL